MIDKNKLPKNWIIKELGEVCKLKNGFSFKSTNYTKIGTPIIRISDIRGGIVSLEDTIKVKPKPEYNNYLVEREDILIAMSGATTGKFGIFKGNEKAFQNQRVGKFKILNKGILSNQFLFYQINSLKRQIEKDAYGGAQPNISSSDIEQMQIVLPPLPEQHRIVTKLEQLFSELDKAVESFKKAKELLKTYRQSVLKYAFEGRFTNKKVKKGELPEGWKWVKLGEVSDKIQDGSHFSPQVQYDAPGKDRYMYITAKNIRNNYMDLSRITYVDKKFHESIYCRCNPEYNDVLLTKDGVNTGEVTLNTLHEPFSLLSSVCIFKPKKSILKSEYLKYFIQSPFGSKVITSSMTGTAIKRIILRKIKDAVICLPPFDEQYIIVQEIEQRLSECDKMEETINQGLKQSETLRQSILKKAFEGKLVPQDTKDEPAEKLLERIKTEKEKIDTTTKKIIRKKK